MIQLTYLDILNIPALLMLGVVTSYQDFKEGKIRNRWIVISVIYSFFSLGAVALLYRIGGGSINPEYVKSFFTNLGFSLGFAVFIWLCKLWSAGDAKLFVAYAALIPMSTYKWQISALFPSYVLLINTFTPIFVFFLARLLMRLKPAVVWDELKKSLSPKLLLNFGLFVFGFSAIGGVLFSMIGLDGGFLIDMVFLLFMMVFFTNALKIDLLRVSIVFSAVRLVLDLHYVFSFAYWAAFLLQMAGFVVLRYFVLNLGFRAFSKPVDVEKLEQGMCLAEDIVDEKGELKKKSSVSLSFLQSIFESAQERKSILSDYTCISEDDVEMLKRLHSEGRLKAHEVLIFEKMSFAIFMFAGVLITLASSGDMIVGIRLLVEKFI